MRPVATEQDSLRFPLNHLLGTPALVRLLRVLSTEVVGPITAPDAAERTGLTEAGARRALGRLSKTGFVRRVGGGRSQQFALRDGDPLTEQLVALFRCEEDRHEELFRHLREALRMVAEVRLAWVDAPPGRIGEPLHIGLIGGSESLSWVTIELRRLIAPIEERFDLTIEVHHFTLADAPDLPWAQTTLLAGVPPVDVTTAGPRAPRHLDRDQRALRLSRAIRRLLNRDPSLARRALSHVDRILRADPGTASQDLREWHAILSQYSQERLQQFLVSSTSRAQRLRQSSPFHAVLNPDERDEILRSLERES